MTEAFIYVEKTKQRFGRYWFEVVPEKGDTIDIGDTTYVVKRRNFSPDRTMQIVVDE